MTPAVIRFVAAGRDGHGRGMTVQVALIGYGEAGSTLARAGHWGNRAGGYDVLADRRAALAADGGRPAQSPAAAESEKPLVRCIVTADQALAAAEGYAAHVAPGTLWCDGNSVAPETKRAAARAVEAAGGYYVDLAILAPVEPKRLAVPLLLSGEHAGEAARQLARLGFSDVRVVGSEVGGASAVKMIRSVMVKGVEALTAEMMLAADAAGVADEVLASLDASEKAMPWTDRAAYNLERMSTHGLRRAAEMEEAARTLVALGVEPVMTAGTVRRQREMAQAATRRSDAA
jgi:3-hydroxyisobutyrate dehydrogenase-like beta-hydroxyacid dehydrogenase